MKLELSHVAKRESTFPSPEPGIAEVLERIFQTNQLLAFLKLQNTPQIWSLNGQYPLVPMNHPDHSNHGDLYLSTKLALSIPAIAQ